MPNDQYTPPRFPLKLFRWFCKPEYHPDIEGDLLEIFELRIKENGPGKARLLLLLDVLLLFRLEIIKPISSFLTTHPTMYRHNFLISWRQLLKNKTYSLLNIGGLAIGMTVAILIGLWIWDELTFNQYHGNYGRIAQVMQNQTFNGKIQTWQGQAKQLGPELRNNYGDHFKYISMASYTGGHTLTYGEKILTQRGVYMESIAPEMLSLQMSDGTRAGLEDPYSILISESAAKAIFGTKNPMNQTIQLDNKHEVKIAGIYQDLPPNSTFGRVQFFASWELYVKGLPDWVDWGNSWFRTYVQIAEQAEFEKVSLAIKDAKLKNSEGKGARFKPALFLHPMSKWHLYRNFENGENVGGRIQYVWMYGIIGIFVLLLACINFMNLSTARSEKRSREVGVRKALGSYRSQLISQFFSESILVALISFLFAILGVQLLLPFFNEIANKQISVWWSNSWFWILGIGFALATGLLSGSYPALYLSSFRAVEVLKGTFRVGKQASIPRKVLVVIQFTVSVTLIIGTIIVFQQIQFAKNRPLGYNQNNLINIPIGSDEIQKHYDVFRNELLKTGAVEEVAKTEAPITRTYITNSGLDWRGKDPEMQEEFVTLRITHEFGKTIGWQIIEGRDFSHDFASDSLGFVINEAAAEYLGFENPVGERIKWGDSDTYTIIGVAKNMITQSPYAPAKQMFFFLDYDRTWNLTVKLSPTTSAREAIAKIADIYSKYDPLNPFDYQFIDEDYARKFGDEERIGKLAGFFAILAIFISCLGLFGMISYMAERRTKEIGIRKVLGASILNLWQLLSKDFVMLVMVSCFIAIPIAFYFMHAWLENYAFHIDISIWVFVAAGLGALLITLFTVSFQAIKAATANPVEALRSE